MRVTAEAIALLSPPERECLRLFHARLSTGEISRKLGISKSKVDAYLDQARRRLEVRNRAEAAKALADYEITTDNVLAEYGRYLADAITGNADKKDERRFLSTLVALATAGHASPLILGPGMDTGNVAPIFLKAREILINDIKNEIIDGSNIARFRDWLRVNRGRATPDFDGVIGPSPTDKKPTGTIAERIAKFDQYVQAQPEKSPSACLQEVFPELAALAQLSVQLPEKAPALWAKDKQEGDTPPDFIKRHYAPWLGKGLGQPQIKALDNRLYMALHNWLRNNDFPADLDLPTIQEQADRTIKLVRDLGFDMPTLERISQNMRNRGQDR